MLAYRRPEGDVACGKFFAGEEFRGAFDTTSASVFSPSGNPANMTWSNAATAFSFEVVGEDSGLFTITVPVDPILLSPARRFLGVNPAMQSTVVGEVHLGWGAQWPQGQPIETDVSASELQRSADDGRTWIPAYSGPATTWSDASLPYDTAGASFVRFRVRVLDTQGHYSRWSNEHVVRIRSSTRVEHDAGGPESGFLMTNFPNPFNPTTTIRFQLPAGGRTTLDVYDVLGRRVRVLLDEHLSPGMHSIVWDGKDDQLRVLAGGVYLYRLSGSGVAAGRTMMLLK
jgi:hypothetical protein